MNYKYVLLFIFALVILTFIYLFLKDNKQDSKSKITGLVSILALFGTFVYLLFFLETIDNNNRNTLNNVLTSQINYDQKGVIDIEKIFIEQSPQLLRLYKQIYPNNVTIQKLTEPPLTEQIIEKEQHVISIMLQNIESISYPLTQKLIPTDTIKYQSWLATFKMWFSSPLVREFWHSHQRLYNRETQEFINQQILV